MSRRTDLYRKPGLELVDDFLELEEQRDDLLEACKNARLGLVTLEQKSGAAWEVTRMLSAAIAQAEGRDDA